MLAGILLSFDSNFFHSNENNSSMNALLTTCIILGFNNSNMVENILVKKPLYNGVEAFTIIISSNILKSVKFFGITF